MYKISQEIEQNEKMNQLREQIEQIRHEDCEYGDETCAVIKFDSESEEFELVKFVACGELTGNATGLVDNWIVVDKDDFELLNLLSSIGYKAEWEEARTYFVENRNGDIADNGLDLADAIECLEEMERKEPDAGWEIMINEY